MKGILLITLLALSIALLAPTVNAQQTCLTVNSTTLNGYLAEIPAINSQLTTCTITIQSNVHSLVGDGNVLVTVGTEQFYLTIQNQRLTGITKGTTTQYGYEVYMSKQIFESLLTSNDLYNDVLRGINNGAITISAKSFWGKIKWFFAKWFIPNPGPKKGGNNNQNQGPKGKPDNCDETYLPGHREYAANKDKWDSYSAKTDGVCQSQYGKGTPSPCAHTVQLSIEGKPYYLCWYNK